MRFFYFLLLLFFIALLSGGCGYRWGESSKKEGFAVPFVEGDTSGICTSLLISELSSRGFQYRNNDSCNLTLKVTLLDWESVPIGYKHSRHNDGELKKSIYPTENKLSVKAQVVIFDKIERKIIFGPKVVSADVDYDYVNQNSLPDLSVKSPSRKRVSVLSFSAGQLEDSSNAEEGACRPLFHQLSQKIVDVISGQW